MHRTRVLCLRCHLARCFHTVPSGPEQGFLSTCNHSPALTSHLIGGKPAAQGHLVVGLDPGGFPLEVVQRQAWAVLGGHPGDTPPRALAGPHGGAKEEDSAARSFVQELPGVGPAFSCGAYGFSCPLSCSRQGPLRVSSRLARPCSVLDLHFLCVLQNLPALDLSWKTETFYFIFFLKVKH